MRDVIVGFQVAKLAKEKGFDWKCFATYYDYPNMYSNYSTAKRVKRDLDKIKLSFNSEMISIHPSEKNMNF